MSFDDTPPTEGDFSIITLNAGPAFGIAEAIDFRNIDRNDTATVNVNSGASTSAEFVTLTTTVVSHELGHLLGLRHGDSFGPLGMGIDSNTVFPNSYNPNFDGPQLADETMIHIMESDSLFIENTVEQFFSERSAIRLAFNEVGTVIPEAGGDKGSIGSAQDIELVNLPFVPNTIEDGDRNGLGDFDVDALVVTGSLDTFGENDFYRIEGVAGAVLNLEVISEVISERLGNTIDSQLSVLDESGNEVDYFGEPAFNDDEFESFDSILIDLVLPEDGTYFIQVQAFGLMDTGNYELFITQFNGEGVEREEEEEEEEEEPDPDLAGDFDVDGDVDIADIDFYVGLIESPATGDLAQLDLDGDGLITFSDLEIHVTSFVQTSNGETGTFLGDFDLDGTVDVLNDAFVLIGSLGTSSSSYAEGDINLDGIVDVLGDAFIFIGNLGSTNGDGDPDGGEDPGNVAGEPPPSARAIISSRNVATIEAVKRRATFGLRKRLSPLWPIESGPLDCRCPRCQGEAGEPFIKELP